MNSGLEGLRKILKNLLVQRRESGPSKVNSELTYYAVNAVAKIFTCQYSKQGEEILRELLTHDEKGIKLLVFATLLSAKWKGASLNYETEIKLLQFKNNPINREIYHRAKKTLTEASALLKAEKAPLN